MLTRVPGTWQALEKYSVVIYLHFLRSYRSILTLLRMLLGTHKQGVTSEVVEFTLLILWLREHKSRKAGRLVQVREC